MNKGIKRMLADIEREVEYTRSLTGIEAFEPKVMTAMAEVPRDLFVDPEMQAHAYDNGPLPIGHGQTISQPYIVALMTDLLRIEPEHRVLEIGTGSGYQTAVLSQLAGQVFSIEYIPELASNAAALFERLNYRNIESRAGNGYHGWPEHAPYDGVIVTAAASHVPQPLIEQLKPGGRLVIPVGQPYMHQELLLIEKDAKGEIHSRDILGVAFVPLQQEEVRQPEHHTLH